MIKIFNGNIVATSSANLIEIGLVTQEISRVTTAPFYEIAKIGILHQISQ